MHTEKQIREAIRPLLDIYGSLTTTEIKEKLSEVLVFDEEDKKRSQTRNEPLVIQRIGNIVAHQGEIRKTYEEGFVVDKSEKPATFTTLTGLGDSTRKLENNEVEERKQLGRQFRARQIDWSAKQKRDSELGKAGEEFVLRYETERVAKFDPQATSRIKHLSEHQGDGLGYDVSSVNDDGSLRLIEVKTTQGPEDTKFFISENEKAFMEIFANRGAVLYRVYNFDLDTLEGDVKIIPAQELLDQYDFSPTNYAVSAK